VYTGKIDGVVGTGTRMSIAKYRMKEGMVPETFLTDSEKAELVDSAIRKNINNIEIVVASINKKAQPTVEKAPVYANNEVKKVVEEKQSQPSTTTETTVVTQTTRSAELPKKTTEKIEEIEEDEFAMPSM
jgi:lysozyme family protein